MSTRTNSTPETTHHSILRTTRIRHRQHLSQDRCCVHPLNSRLRSPPRHRSIDGVGGSTVRGEIDNAADFARDRSVPLGVLANARLTRDVPADHLVSYDDVELDESSLIVKLRRLQEASVEGSLPTLDELKELLATA